MTMTMWMSTTMAEAAEIRLAFGFRRRKMASLRRSMAPRAHHYQFIQTASLTLLYLVVIWRREKMDRGRAAERDTSPIEPTLFSVPLALSERAAVIALSARAPSRPYFGSLRL